MSNLVSRFIFGAHQLLFRVIKHNIFYPVIDHEQMLLKYQETLPSSVYETLTASLDCAPVYSPTKLIEVRKSLFPVKLLRLLLIQNKTLNIVLIYLVGFIVLAGISN